MFSVFVGGSLGSDPWASRTWSGTSRNLLSAMQTAGVLDEARGVTLPKLDRILFQLKTFSPDRAAWRQRFFLNVPYRNANTRAAGKIKVPSPVLLQIGHWFSLPDVFPDKLCISYHDGNLAQSAGSRFGLKGVSRSVIDAALRYEEQTAQKMSAIFTFSEYLRQSFIRDYRVAPERVFNVGVGVEPNPIPEEQPDKDYSTPRVLFVGIDFQRKGGEELLRAFRQVRQAVPNAELHIVGPAPREQTQSGVTWHGRLSKTDPMEAAKLDRLFREASLFTLPSLYEPFGLAPLEAMHYQLPCLLSDDWALREMVTPGESGDLAAVGSADDLASKMIALLSHPQRLRQMGMRARNKVAAYYRWDGLVERMVQAVEVLQGTLSR